MAQPGCELSGKQDLIFLILFLSFRFSDSCQLQFFFLDGEGGIFCVVFFLFLSYFIIILFTSCFMDLQIEQRNCRSIINKQVWLTLALFSSANVLVFQETFLSPDKMLQMPGWIVYSQDRLGRSGGGLVIAVSFSWS